MKNKYELTLLMITMLLLSACSGTPRANTTQETSTVTITEKPTKVPVTKPLIPPSPTATPVFVPDVTWTEISRMKKNRSEMPAVYLDGRIYVISGLDNGPQLSAQKTSEVYDIASGQWQSMSTIPKAHHHGMAVAYDGKIYYFGGSPSATLDGTTDAWVYNVDTDDWEEIAPLPLPRSAGAAVVYNDSIYILGGVGNLHSEQGANDNGETLRYDPATDTWILLAPPLTRREHTTAALISNQIYVFGGRWTEELDSSDIYDPASDTWKPGPDLPNPHAGNGLAVFNGLVYLIGGEIWMSGPEETLATVDVFDPATGNWSSIPDLPTPLHGVPAVATEEMIYVIGGSKIAALASNANTLLVFRP